MLVAFASYSRDCSFEVLRANKGCDPIEHRRAGITASDGRGVLRVLDTLVASGRGHQAVALGTLILAAY
jgi:hypothetical protein